MIDSLMLFLIDVCGKVKSIKRYNDHTQGAEVKSVHCHKLD